MAGSIFGAATGALMLHKRLSSRIWSAKGDLQMGMPVEIEWVHEDEGRGGLRAHRLYVEPECVSADLWLWHPGLSGHPAGIGRRIK